MPETAETGCARTRHAAAIPQEVAAALIPENVAYHFSAEFETLYVTLEARQRGPLPPIRIPAASLREFFRWHANLVSEAARKRLGGRPASPQDGDVVATPPNPGVSVRAVVEAPGAGVIILSMAVRRFALLYDIDELRELGAECGRIADATGDIQGKRTAWRSPGHRFRRKLHELDSHAGVLTPNDFALVVRLIGNL